MEKILLPALIFTGTGILSTLVAQILISSGAGESWTMLLPFSNYAGMALAAFVPDALAGGGSGGSGGGGGAPAAAKVAEEAAAAAGRQHPSGSGGGGGCSSAALLLGPWLRLLEVPRAPGHRPAPPGTLTVPLPTYVLLAICIDILGFWLHVQGIRYAGSALFQVIYCSVVVWAALGYWAARTQLGSRALLAAGVIEYLTPPAAPGDAALPAPAEFNALQGWGIAMVMCGLACTALGESSSSSSGGGSGGGGGGGGAGGLRTPASIALVLYGLACSTACAVCYGVVYTLCEFLMSQPSPPKAQAVSARVGGGICLVLGAYIAVGVLPRWGDVAARVAEVGILTPQQVALGYGVMLLSAVAHSITYFQLMGQAGAVTTSIMQAARAVGVFVVSALLLCSSRGAWQLVPALAQESQCFTFVRGVTTLLVCLGILTYSQGKVAAKGSLHHSLLPVALAAEGGSGKARHSFAEARE
jgi:hypothetical protein